MIPSHREPTHPGEMLLEEFLRPLGLTQVAAAGRMRIPLNRLNEIIRGKRGITADTAIRLSRVFGTSPEFWMNLQSTWDIYQAAKSLHVDLDSVRHETTAAASTPDREELRTNAWTSSFIANRVELAPVERMDEEDLCDKTLDLDLVA